MARWTVLITPRKFTLMVARSGGARSPSASRVSSKKDFVGPMPALAKTWSMWPKRCWPRMKRARMLPQLVTSVSAKKIFGVLRRSSGRGVRSPAMIFAPSWWHSLRVALPMPELHPVCMSC